MIVYHGSYCEIKHPNIEFSRVTEKDLEESMDYFYNSITYDLISNGVGDMHCRGVKYLTDELFFKFTM